MTISMMLRDLPSWRHAYWGARTVRFVKPYADNGKVKDQMQYAVSAMLKTKKRHERFALLWSESLPMMKNIWKRS